MKLSLSLFLLLILNQFYAAGFTTITGNAPEYAGEEINFYIFLDPISEETQSLFKLNFDKNGNFKTTIQLEEIAHAFADFDSYSANIYLVPDETYEIILPKRKIVTSSQKHNPFFKPIQVHLAVKDSNNDELNFKIREFEKSYREIERPYFTQVYRNKSSASVDSIRLKVESEFPESTDPFFEEYKFYRLAFPEFALHHGKNEFFVKKYFNRSPNFRIAPCKNLFNRTYSNFFSQLTNSVDGSEFKNLLASAKLSEIESYLIDKHHLIIELAQLVILKSIHDAFHQGQFSQKSLLLMLSEIQAGDWPLKHKLIASRLEKKLTHLLPGTLAPSLSFHDFNGKAYSLAEFRGQQVYIHFTRVSNPICRQHLDALRKLPEAVKKEIEVINLILEEEKSQKNQLAKQNWIGKFFIVDQETVENWKVKSFPTSFLINAEGKLIYSPANNPLDGFGKQIGVFLQKKHMRN